MLDRKCHVSIPRWGAILDKPFLCARPPDLSCWRVSSVRSGSSMMAPMRKQIAPTRVWVSARPALCTWPVTGLTYPATAEMPNAMEPIRLTSVIHHDHDAGRQAAQPWQASYQDRTLDTRKQTEPIASGRHTC